MITLRKVIERAPGGAEKHLIRQFNLGNRCGQKCASVKELALGLGFKVRQTELVRGEAGRLVRDCSAENGYRIDVNLYHSVQRQRFSVLHEIVHWLFHIEAGDFLSEPLFRETGVSAFYLEEELVQEREANQGAAAILFDHGALRAIHARYDGDLEKVARHFGVSKSTVEVGLKQFF